MAWMRRIIHWVKYRWWLYKGCPSSNIWWDGKGDCTFSLKSVDVMKAWRDARKEIENSEV